VLAGSTLALTALLLGACSDDDGSSSTTTDQATTTTVVNTSSLADVEISADTAVAPTVTFDPSFALADTTAVETEVVVAGEGATVADGQRLSLDYVVISGIDGAELESTWGQQPEVVPLDATLQEGIKNALVGQQVGARVAATSYAQGQWVIFVFDIRDAVTVPTSASGTEVPPVDGLPTVAVVEGVPTVTLPGTPPPTELVIQPLIVGDGPTVESGQTVTVQYVGVLWSDGSVFDSSWERGAPVDFPVGTGGVLPGFEEGLIGQTVGSRVMLIIPPDEGYGEQGNPQAGITGTETLVFVIDVLAAS
jgi:peptidylprolyl isomerase